MSSRVMYIELKKDGVRGTARIGRVTFSKNSLYGTTVFVDEDCRKEYWRKIRGMPESVSNTSYRSPGKSERERDSQEKAARRRNMDRRWRPTRHRAPGEAEQNDDHAKADEESDDA